MLWRSPCSLYFRTRPQIELFSLIYYSKVCFWFVSSPLWLLVMNPRDKALNQKIQVDNLDKRTNFWKADIILKWLCSRETARLPVKVSTLITAESGFNLYSSIIRMKCKETWLLSHCVSQRGVRSVNQFIDISTNMLIIRAQFVLYRKL